MKVKIDGNSVFVTLSERNLKTLLIKSETPDPSSRTIYRRDGELTIYVAVESDEKHYQGRQPGPALEEAQILKRLADAVSESEKKRLARSLWNVARGGMRDYAPAEPHEKA